MAPRLLSVRGFCAKVRSGTPPSEIWEPLLAIAATEVTVEPPTGWPGGTATCQLSDSVVTTAKPSARFYLGRTLVPGLKQTNDVLTRCRPPAPLGTGATGAEGQPRASSGLRQQRNPLGTSERQQHSSAGGSEQPGTCPGGSAACSEQNAPERRSCFARQRASGQNCSQG